MVSLKEIVAVPSGLQTSPLCCVESFRMAMYSDPLIQLSRSGSDPNEVPLSEVTPAILSRSFKVSDH